MKRQFEALLLLAAVLPVFLMGLAILGYASWHAYCALFEDLDHAR